MGLDRVSAPDLRGSSRESRPSSAGSRARRRTVTAPAAVVHQDGCGDATSVLRFRGFRFAGALPRPCAEKLLDPSDVTAILHSVRAPHGALVAPLDPTVEPHRGGATPTADAYRSAREQKRSDQPGAGSVRKSRPWCDATVGVRQDRVWYHRAICGKGFGVDRTAVTPEFQRLLSALPREPKRQGVFSLL